jgi:hypothetical protein
MKRVLNAVIGSASLTFAFSVCALECQDGSIPKDGTCADGSTAYSPPTKPLPKPPQPGTGNGGQPGHNENKGQEVFTQPNVDQNSLNKRHFDKKSLQQKQTGN